MDRSGDDFESLRRRLLALRGDPDAAEALSAATQADLARIRAHLHRLAVTHAESWRRLGPLGGPR